MYGDFLALTEEQKPLLFLSHCCYLLTRILNSQEQQQTTINRKEDLFEASAIPTHLSTCRFWGLLNSSCSVWSMSNSWCSAARTLLPLPYSFHTVSFHEPPPTTLVFTCPFLFSPPKKFLKFSQPDGPTLLRQLFSAYIHNASSNLFGHSQ